MKERRRICRICGQKPNFSHDNAVCVEGLEKIGRVAYIRQGETEGIENTLERQCYQCPGCGSIWGWEHDDTVGFKETTLQVLWGS